MIRFRQATLQDSELLFKWANDEQVRANSYNQDPILLESHKLWLERKLNEANAIILVFSDEENVPIGLIRFQVENNHAVVGILIDRDQRGKGYASQMLTSAGHYFHQRFPNIEIHAFVKLTNLPSYHAFLKAGYVLKETLLVNDKDESFKLVKSNENR